MREPSEALRRLVTSAELIDVSYMELVARRNGDMSLPSQSEEAEGPTVSPDYQLGIEHNSSNTRFRLRLKVEITGDFGVVVAEAAAEYERRDFPLEELTQELLVDYANNVAVMTLLPYLRQAIADLTQRVFDAPLLMPVLLRGAVSFAAPDE